MIRGFGGRRCDELDRPYGDTCVVLEGYGSQPINMRCREAWREGIGDYL